MPAPIITTVIPPVVDLPGLSDSVEEFDEKAIEVWPQFNASTALINQAFGEFNVAAAAVFQNSDLVVAARDAVLAAVNFKGPWAGLTGALAVPASVLHANGFWILLENLSNVTLDEPGVSLKWARVVAEAESVLFDGPQYNMKATNVQAALGELSVVQKHNPILNGDMTVAQSGTSFNVSADIGQNLIDGWLFSKVHNTATFTISQQAAPTPRNSKAKWLVATANTAGASISSTQYCYIIQKLEGYEIEELVGRTFTISFFVKSSVVGIHSVCIRSPGYDASYVAEVNIVAANTPQLATVTVVGGLPAFGTWNFTNGIGMELGFVMAAGSTFRAAPNSWNAGQAIASTSQVNVLSTAANSFAITEVQINLGPVAAKFQRPSYQEELARCQRYYERTDWRIAYGDGTLNNFGYWHVEKRDQPLLTIEHGIGTGSGVIATFSTNSARNGFVQTGSSNAGTVGLDANKIVIGDARFT